MNDHYKPELLKRDLPCDAETMADLVLGMVDQIQAPEPTTTSEGVSAWRLRVR